MVEGAEVEFVADFRTAFLSSAAWCDKKNMPQCLKELTEEALRLPPDERVVLAESLLLTIDEEHDQLVDEAIMTELERRLQDFREGKVKGIPAEEAFRRIREQLKNRS